jgi:hypothetical protein
VTFGAPPVGVPQKSREIPFGKELKILVNILAFYIRKRLKKKYFT